MPVVNHQTRSPPAFVIYRLNGKMVYVTPPVNHEQALDFAQKVFWQQLSGIKCHRIVFAVTCTHHGKQVSVGIAEMAWGAVVATLHCSGIIDVHVQPEVHIIDDEGAGKSKQATKFFSRKGKQDMSKGAKGWLEKHVHFSGTS